MEAVLLVICVVALAAAVALVAGARRDVRISRWRVTQVARTAERLREDLRIADEERRQMELVLSSMDEGVLLFDGHGRRRFSNPAAEELLGTRPAAVGAILPLALREAVVHASEASGATTAAGDIGEPPRSLRGSAVPVGADGSVLLVIQDVTEAMRIDAVRRDFVANASHELRTPAASIQAAAETIGTAADDDPSVVARFAHQLERDAARLSRIVSDLLDLSRLESGGALEERVRLDVLVREEGERAAGTADEAGVALSVEADAVPPVGGSGRDLSLLVRNLLDNAIHYTRAGGRVSARVERDDGHVVLTVRDTGIGIPTRDLPRIFERFYRVDRARSRDTGGTGLGLSIVKHVADNHGGTVSVRSELGVGSTFEVRLPVAEGA